MDAGYWDSRGGNEINHLLTKMDILLALRRAMSAHPIKTVLDVGCGAGVCFPLYHDLGCEALGLDFSGRRVRIANDLARALGYGDIRAQQRDVVRQPLPPGPFDAAVVSELLHHLSHEEVVMVVEKIKEVTGLVFVVAYYSEPLVDLAVRHNARCSAAGLPFNVLAPEKGFTSAVYDYPALFGMPHEYVPLRHRDAALLIFGGKCA